MKCSYLTLSQYLDNELDDAKAGEVDAHLVGCTRCKNALDNIRVESKRIRQLVHIHAEHDAIHHLFDDLSLETYENDRDDESLQPVPKPKGDDTPPWLRAEATGAALPWAPNGMPRESIPGPSSAPPPHTTGQQGDPSPSPVPSSPHPAAGTGSPAALPSSLHGESGSVPNVPRAEVASNPPSAGDRTPQPEMRRVQLPGTADVRSLDDVETEPPSPVAPPEKQASPWARPVIAERTEIVGEKIPFSGNAHTSAGMPPQNPGSAPPPGEGWDTGEKKSPFSPLRGLTDDDFDLDLEEEEGIYQGELLTPHASFIDTLKDAAGRVMSLIHSRRKAEPIEVVSGIGAPLEHSRTFARRAGVSLGEATERAKSWIKRLQSGRVPHTKPEPISGMNDPALASPTESRPSHNPNPYRSRFDTFAVAETEEDWAKQDERYESESHVGRHELRAQQHREQVKRQKKASRFGSHVDHARTNFTNAISRRPLDRNLQIVGIGIVCVVVVGLLVGEGLRMRTPSQSGHPPAISKSLATTATKPSVQPTATSTPAQTIALANEVTIGQGGKGVSIQDERYGQHTGYYRVVFDMTGAVEPTALIGLAQSGNEEIVIIKGASPEGQPNTLSEVTTVSAVTMIPPTAGVDETVYEFTLVKPCTVQESYLPDPSRLIVDFYPQT